MDPYSSNLLATDITDTQCQIQEQHIEQDKKSWIIEKLMTQF